MIKSEKTSGFCMGFLHERGTVLIFKATCVTICGDENKKAGLLRLYIKAFFVMSS